MRENERENEEQIAKLEEQIEIGRKTLKAQEQNLQNLKNETDKEKKIRKAELDKVLKEEGIKIDRLKKEIEKLTQQVATITKAYNEETVERQKLEQAALETAERINNNSLLPDLTKIELHEAKQKIVQLLQVIETQKGLITAGKISLESKEKQIADWKETLNEVNERNESEIQAKNDEWEKRLNERNEEHNKEINAKTEEINKLISKKTELEVLKISFLGKERDLENTQAKLNRADNVINQAFADITKWKTKAENTELDLKNARAEIQQLRNELRSQEPTWYQKAGKWIADKTGFTAARNLITNLATVGLIIGIIWGFSFFYRLFKSFLANFKSEPKSKSKPSETKIVEIIREKEPIQVIEPTKTIQPQPVIDSKPTVEVKVEPKPVESQPTIETKLEPKPNKTKKPKKTKKKKRTSN